NANAGAATSTARIYRRINGSEEDKSAIRWPHEIIPESEDRLGKAASKALIAFRKPQPPRRVAYDARNSAEIPGKNPKGIPQQSPGLRGTSYPGQRWSVFHNPNGVVASLHCRCLGPQPFQGCYGSDA